MSLVDTATERANLARLINPSLLVALLFVLATLLSACGGIARLGDKTPPLERDINAYMKLKEPKAFAFAIDTSLLFVNARPEVWAWSFGMPNLEDAKEAALTRCEEEVSKRGGPIPCFVWYENNSPRRVAFQPEAAERLATRANRDRKNENDTFINRCRADGKWPTKVFEGAELIEPCYAAQILLGMWSGTTCKHRFEFDISVVDPKSDKLEFHGTIRILDYPNPSSSILKQVNGYIRYRGGFIHTDLAATYTELDSTTLGLFRMDLARNPSGDGLVGSSENQCNITLTRGDRRKPDYLPLPTTTVILAEYNNYQPFTKGGFIYWLHAAETGGASTKDFYDIAQRYLLLGDKHSDTYYQKALECFSKAANQVPPHISSQMALSKMYLQGLGTTKNLPEANRWNKLSAPAMGKAVSVCKSEIAMRKIEHRFTQQDSFQLISAAPSHLYTVDDPFECEYVFGRPNAIVELRDMEKPRHLNSPFEFPDEIFDGVGSQIATNMARKIQRVETLFVTPLGSNKFRLTHRDDSEPILVELR